LELVTGSPCIGKALLLPVLDREKMVNAWHPLHWWSMPEC